MHINRLRILFFAFILMPLVFAQAFSVDDQRLLDEIEKASFQFFWQEVSPDSGLVRDRTGKEVCSVASVGFELAALPIGVERGYVHLEQAKNRAIKVLKTLQKSKANYKGIFCHFVDLTTGNPTHLGYENIASTIDTALLMAGAIVAGEYFNGEVRDLAMNLFAGADWVSFVNTDNGQVFMAADINSGKFEKQTWNWYSDETLLIVLLGQSSPNPAFRLPTGSMTNWNRPAGKYKDGQEYIYSHPGTLFTYMFAHCFYDFRQTGNDSLGVNWFENTAAAVEANRNWCRDNPNKYQSYGQNLWGITAGSGPGNNYVVLGHPPRGAVDNQGKYGTLHPYGAAMSLPFAEVDAMNALKEMRNLKVNGKPIWKSIDEGGYGFWDGFNIDQNWVSDHVIGIAQGPMLLMIENARTGLIWKLMMKNKNIKEGLKRAGFNKQQESK